MDASKAFRRNAGPADRETHRIGPWVHETQQVPAISNDDSPLGGREARLVALLRPLNQGVT
jgi:hypothetical protein